VRWRDNGKVYNKGGGQGCRGNVVEYGWRGRVEV
jgi:hypothetical protein